MFLLLFLLKLEIFKRGEKPLCNLSTVMCCFFLEKTIFSEEGENHFCNLTNDDTAAFPLRNQDFGKRGKSSFVIYRKVILLVFFLNYKIEKAEQKSFFVVYQ